MKIYAQVNRYITRFNKIPTDRGHNIIKVPPTDVEVLKNSEKAIHVF